MFQQLHVLYKKIIFPSTPGQGLYHTEGQREACYLSTVLITSSLPLNFQFQQALPFKWAAFGLPNPPVNNPQHTFNFMSFNECQVFNPSWCVFILYNSYHCQGFKKISFLAGENQGIILLMENQVIQLSAFGRFLMSLSLQVVCHVRSQTLRAPST